MFSAEEMNNNLHRLRALRTQSAYADYWAHPKAAPDYRTPRYN